MRTWKGGIPGISYPFKYLEKHPISLKRNRQISPKFTQLQKALYQNVPKSPLNFHKSILYPFKYLANIPHLYIQGLHNAFRHEHNIVRSQWKRLDETISFTTYIFVQKQISPFSVKIRFVIRGYAKIIKWIYI